MRQGWRLAEDAVGRTHCCGVCYANITAEGDQASQPAIHSCINPVILP
jgi:hypothetical protein